MIYTNLLDSLKKIIINDKALFNCTPCPDSKRGLIEYKNNRFSYITNHQDVQTPQKLIFILESPHKEEFKDDYSPIAPAQGETGRRFEISLVNVCILAQYHHTVFNEGVYEVWLVNAIQYQVSLGLKTTEYRSVLFQIAWFLFGKHDFIRRIKLLVGNDTYSILINACTKGNEFGVTQAKKLLKELVIPDCIKLKVCLDDKVLDLRNLVDNAITDCKLPNKHFRASHPYKWDVLV